MGPLAAPGALRAVDGAVSDSDHCRPPDWRETRTQDFAYQGKYALAGGPPVFCVLVLKLGTVHVLEHSVLLFYKWGD